MASGRRWNGSIRLRLAAWYAAIVLVVIVALGASFSILLERELRSDVDTQILNTATRVRGDVDVYVNAQTGEVFGRPVIPDLYSFPSLLIQVVSANGEILASS